MDAIADPRHEQFRAEVRAFLEEALTPDMRAEAALQSGISAHPELGLRWHRILHQKGWVAPAWPAEYGGPGWDVVERHIFEEECLNAGAPTLWVSGLQLVGPVLMRYGTEEQKQRFLPRILSGEDYWAQGFSEPGAGSDLASLRTRAVRDGDSYVVNGTKIWTTHAHHADWIFLLVRTSDEGRKQQGISFLLTPKDAPGITIRPIRSMSGEHEVNQVFFDGLRIPVENLVGAEGQGWEIARYLLEYERGGSYAALAFAMLRDAKHIATQRPRPAGGVLWDDPAVRRRHAALEIRATAQAWLEKRNIAAMVKGQDYNPVMPPIMKLRGSEIQQDISAFVVETLGGLALVDHSESLAASKNLTNWLPDEALRPMAVYLDGRAKSIFGGSNEIQRNLIARAILSGQVL